MSSKDMHFNLFYCIYEEGVHLWQQAHCEDQWQAEQKNWNQVKQITLLLSI